jgi:LysR family transcriptional regulator, nitrogen assimilation regulatory protein
MRENVRPMRAIDLDLKPLHYFVTIASLGSLSKAAAVLSVGQPALSRDIKRLEERHGVPLLYRNGRGVTPTPAGEILLSHAQALLRDLGNMNDELTAQRKTLTGRVAIAVPPMFGHALNFGLIREFHTRHPEVSLSLMEGFTADVVIWLANGNVDFGIVYNPPTIATLISEHLSDDNLCLVGRPDRDFRHSGGSDIAFRDLAHIPMILPPAPHRLRSLIDDAAREAGVRLRLEIEVTGTATMLDLVRGRVGFTILPSILVRQVAAIGQVDVWPIVDPRITPRLFMVTSMRRPMTPALQSVLAAVRQQFSGRQGR